MATEGAAGAPALRELSKRGIRIGTASWTDKSLLDSGRFYPADVKSPEERLRYYASIFPFVEIDSTYYTLEFSDQARRWADRTPEDFLFDVKAFRLLTLHQTPHKMLPASIRDAVGDPPEGKRNWYYKDFDESARDEAWSTFEGSLEPLRHAGKLGAVIFQLPPWAMPSPETQQHLQECADRLDGYRIAVEFRNQYWLSDRNKRRTLAFLRENGMAYVIVDEPQGFRSSVPLAWEVTDPALAVVRLHGRNAETWEKKGLRSAAERFNYLYDEPELREFADPIRELRERSEEVHATFNNNYEDYPQRNAAEFARLLTAAS
jgi:uncharacterized protein YecE (DUF72 family)